MKLWQTAEICSNPGFLLEPKKNYRPELQGNRMQKQYLLGPVTWRDTRRNVERYCELANKTTQQLYKVATPCMDDHQFQEEENESSWRIVYSLLTNCFEMSYWET